MPNINTAYQWAVRTCNAPNIGYDWTWRNQQTVDGVTYYDCSSFIWYALIAGGFDCVAAHGGDTWPFTTYDMTQALTALGFKQVPLSGEWKPGDIGLFPGDPDEQTGHTEMVYSGGIGHGVCMGAHTSTVPLADQVSIGPGESYASRWESLWRYGDGADGGTGYGWSLAAFCALMGNVAVESEYNPGQIEGGYTIENGAGIGLFQWTPDGRRYGELGNPLINQASAHGKTWTDPEFQCEMLNNADQASYGAPEEWGWITAYSPPSSMSEFRQGTDVARLTEAWMRNVERPYIPTANLERRIATARQWYTRLQGVDPVTEAAKCSWHVVQTSSYGALTEQQIYENVIMMYNIFCGSGGGGGGGTGRKKRKGMPVWMMIRYHY